MKVMYRLVTVFLLATSPLAQAAADDDMLWSFRYVLATATNFGELGPVAAHLFDEKEYRTPEVLDLAAEFLETHHTDEADQTNRTHLVRLLGRSEDPRYYTVLLRIANEKRESEAKKMARLALDRKKRPDFEQFKAGMSQTAMLRDEYARAALEVAPTPEAAQRFSDIPPGWSLQEVFRSLGRPQSVIARFLWRGDMSPYEQLLLEYRGLGRVDIQNSRRGWVVKYTHSAGAPN